MAIANVYLTFDGDCEEAFELYRSVFGGDYAMMSRFGEMPPDPEYPIDDAHKDRIMHVTLPIGGETVLMGSDTMPGMSPQLKQGNNFSISVATESREEADRMFAALAEGGTVTMPQADTFWNSYFGMCRDRFGVQWMVDYTEAPA
jgi:PhnB protein